ncbi:MAG: translation initiation factor IF-2 [Pseudomonadota bacterium]|nr:translation initiation factor IF-2 [Pseudomonadota bacterium]
MVTVKDFAKTLKISEEALLSRMQNAGLSHTSAGDEVTAAHKQILLRSLKQKQKTTATSMSPSGVGIKVKSKISQGKSDETESKSYSDNIEAKRQAASEALKAEQKKREEQLKKAAAQKKDKFAEKPVKKDPTDVKDDLSKAAKDYIQEKDQESGSFDSHQFEKPVEFIKREIEVPESIQVGELAKLMHVKGGEVLTVLLGLGVTATINDLLDQETAILAVDEIGHTGIAKESEDIEEDLLKNIEYTCEKSSRNPVVTVMGHVDHGKTTLLDYIRKAKVVDSEAGGITQHIGAYEVQTKNGDITFIDTPGHAAFSAMRARGANTTDIVILVVAANDGIMPQTEEAIDHAKAADVSIIVAINKIDLDGVDPEKIKGDLGKKDLVPEDWGGNIQMIPVSALNGDGIDNLLEAINLEAEMLELKAFHEGDAQGIVIESELDKFKGAVATLLVQNGSLKVGQVVIADQSFGKVKALTSSLGTKLKSAGPSCAVEVLGLDSAPAAGSVFQVVKNEKVAREIINYREQKDKEKKQIKQRDDAAGDIFESMGKASRKFLNVIIKTDVAGTAEAINASLEKLGNDDVSVKIISSGVGGISESDANLAITTEASILGFNVRADNAAKKIIEEEDINLTYYSIIYELIDDVKALLGGLLDPIIREEIIGTAEVLEVFNSPKFGQVAGCNVFEGKVLRNKPIRVLRDEVVIFQGELDSLRRFKDDVNEVKEGTECGMGIKNYKDIKPGDKIEVFNRVEEQQTI